VPNREGKRRVTDNAGSLVVNHIGLCVHDIDRSRRFYEELLGFTFEHEIVPPDDVTGKLLSLDPPLGLRAVYLRKDGFRLELLAYEDQLSRTPARERPMDEPGLTHISLGAVDVAGLLERVEGLGGTVLGDTDIGVAVFIRDPDGQLIELLESKASKEDKGAGGA
jgi:catechol 2,3-dioxygenase-like lactoylglutathione lyase family enzyme